VRRKQCASQASQTDPDLARSVLGQRQHPGSDFADTLDVLESCLQFEGAAVDVAASATEALNALHRCDIVVTDFALPERDGIWLLEQASRAPSPVQVILLSGYAAQQVPYIAAAPSLGSCSSRSIRSTSASRSERCSVGRKQRRVRRRRQQPRAGVDEMP